MIIVVRNNFDFVKSKIAQKPAAVQVFVSLWTHGESHSGLVHAMDACYYYTMGPICF